MMAFNVVCLVRANPDQAWIETIYHGLRAMIDGDYLPHGHGRVLFPIRPPLVGGVLVTVVIVIRRWLYNNRLWSS